MNKPEKEYLYESEYGGTYSLVPWINMYADNNNLCLGFNYRDEEFGNWEPFCYATVNIIPLSYLEGTIDINDNGHKFLDFLESNGFGKRTSFIVPSGLCTYPVFSFNEEKIREIDPEMFAEYQKAYGKEKTSLGNRISCAEAKSGFGVSKHEPELDH